MDLSTLNYKQVREVAVNSDFQAKLAIAIADAAITVSVAAAVLLANNDDDATLKAIVLTLWNAFAGVA